MLEGFDAWAGMLSRRPMGGGFGDACTASGPGFRQPGCRRVPKSILAVSAQGHAASRDGSRSGGTIMMSPTHVSLTRKLPGACPRVEIAIASAIALYD
jgi:hypothetical protein